MKLAWGSATDGVDRQPHVIGEGCLRESPNAGRVWSNCPEGRDSRKEKSTSLKGQLALISLA